MPKKINSTTTIDPKEIEKFHKMAEEWWDEEGKFAPLHKFNPCRISYIRDAAITHFKLKHAFPTPLKGLNIVDIGCGGGLLAEPLTRLGATVTGIDAGEQNIKIAKHHATKTNLTIDYQNIAAEELAKNKRKFDIVLAMEVIEHVSDTKLFIESCCKLLKPGGLLFIATINRTYKAYLLAILGAEYILNWLPRGTHDWNKFLKPSEIAAELEKHNVALQEIKGASFSPIRRNWNLTDDISVNYIMLVTK